MDARERVLDAAGEVERGEVTGEVHACEVELITNVCSTAGEAVGVLADLRRAVLATGVGVMGTATHPTAEEDASEISDKERYRFIAEHLGDALATPVAALHVHIGMPDADAAIRAFNGLRRHLPLLEALGANAPFRHGRDTSFASARELALRSWARPGTPRAMADYDDFIAYADRLTRAAGVPDYTFHWWKLRPHPQLGTVEVRALDAQSSPAHVASLVALVHALAQHEATAEPVPVRPEILEEASYRAGRDGLAAALPDIDGTVRPSPMCSKETLALARPAAQESGRATASLPGSPRYRRGRRCGSAARRSARAAGCPPSSPGSWSARAARGDPAHRGVSPRPAPDAVAPAVALLEEVPRLDPVALGVGEVQRAVAAVVLDRALRFHAELGEPAGDVIEPSAVHGERVVHVPTALVAELLLTGGPETQPGALAAGQPHAIVAAVEHREAEHRAVEAGEAVRVLGLQRQLTQSPGRDGHAPPLTREAPDAYPRSRSWHLGT